MEQADVPALVCRAKLAEQARRYMEMMGFMLHLAERKETAFSKEERNLLGIAFKNVITARRVSWRVLMANETQLSNKVSSLGDHKSTDGQKEMLKQCRLYRGVLEKEICKICQDILQSLQKHILPKTDPSIAALDSQVEAFARRSYKDVRGLEDDLKRLFSGEEAGSRILRITNAENVVFYYKMKGDLYRYLVETAADYRGVTSGEDINMALCWYYVSREVAKAHLSPADPVRLGLGLNFSVFYQQIMAAPSRACEVAKDTFDEAVLEMPARGSVTFEDSSLIMGFLRDNLTSWTKENRRPNKQEGKT
ncbi:hypothetical protein AAMO2058_000224400 [Amorphochlora amoebiformis]